MANGSKFEFDMPSIDAVASNIEEYQKQFEAGLKVVCDTVGNLMANYAKAHGPWKNQTGNARQTLFHNVSVSRSKIEIVVAHRMEYGFWLELAHQRKYKILEESIEANIGELVSAVKELL